MSMSFKRVLGWMHVKRVATLRISSNRGKYQDRHRKQMFEVLLGIGKAQGVRPHATRRKAFSFDLFTFV